MTPTILVGHVLDRLREIPSGTVQTCVTSPPYWGLRAYGTEPQVWGGDPVCPHRWQQVSTSRKGSTNGRGDLGSTLVSTDALKTLGAGQTNDPVGTAQYRTDLSGTCDLCGAWRGELGLEPTPELYVAHLVQVFAEVRRVLRKDGTLWLNLGDSYAADRSGTHMPAETMAGGVSGCSETEGAWRGRGEQRYARRDCTRYGLKHKDLVGIPWTVALALRDDGWYLRSDIVWAKSVSGQKEHTGQIRTAMKKAGLSADAIHRVLAHMEPYIGTCMPESVRDRPTRSHEYLFLLTKTAKAYCQMGEVRESSTGVGGGGWSRAYVAQQLTHGAVRLARPVDTGGRNRRSVWQISPKPYKGAHFATFPPELVEPCVLAGTSPVGQCQKCGAPWVPVYRKTGRADSAALQAVGADTNGEYHGTATKDYAAGNAQDPSAVKARIIAGMGPKDTSYEPSCRHELAPVPQTVLDPFGGSGTTAAVALQHGRRAILIELNPSYLPLIEQRVKESRALRPRARRSPEAERIT